jgi:putative transcriptional regulator
MRWLQGHFLIAMPAMGDPNFSETVTYVCKHDAEGALGVVINRPSDMTLGEVFEQLDLEVTDTGQVDRRVLRGGPVERDRGFVLHRSAAAYASSLEGAAVRVTLSPDILAALASGAGPDPAVVALGYAGWGAGQLEAELRANAWLTAEADPDIIFATPFDQRWSAALGLPDVDIKHITDYAGHA